jgi:hypothetical protein
VTAFISGSVVKLLPKAKLKPGAAMDEACCYSVMKNDSPYSVFAAVSACDFYQA